MTLFERLKAACRAEWRAYTEHRFVSELGQGTLPLPVFQNYLVQDYLFLIQFARANALAAYKSRRIADIHHAHAALSAVLSETELHVELAQRWGISRADLESAPEQQATVAYTRYVLDAGAAGDLAELSVALAPCVIGYAEIGRSLAHTIDDEHGHPYREWITEYSSAGYQQTAHAAIERLDALAEHPTTRQRLARLTEVFSTATRLEVDFWQQAFDSATAPRASSCAQRRPDG